jgi:F-type H+-transporting ATPase subunit a
MVVAVLLTMGLLVYGMRQRAIVPGRLQSLAETAYEFVHELVTGQVGDEGKRFFPFVFALFMFVLFGNPLGTPPLRLHLHQPHRGHLRAGDDCVRAAPPRSRSASMACISSAISSRKARPKVLAPLIIPIEVIS